MVGQAFHHFDFTRTAQAFAAREGMVDTDSFQRF
jgi:hypothetical protein